MVSLILIDINFKCTCILYIMFKFADNGVANKNCYHMSYTSKIVRFRGLIFKTNKMIENWSSPNIDKTQ